MEKIIKEYINNYPQEIQVRLNLIYNVVKNEIPELNEKMSYGMPTFYLKKNFFHFAAFKNHIGIYPGKKAILFFKEDLNTFKTSVGAIQFQNDQDIPLDLIKNIVIFLKDNLSK